MPRLSYSGTGAARGLHRLRLEGFGFGLREDQVLKQGRTSGHGWGAHIARLGEQRVVGLTAGGFDAAARHQVGRTDQAGGQASANANAAMVDSRSATRSGRWEVCCWVADGLQSAWRVRSCLAPLGP